MFVASEGMKVLTKKRLVLDLKTATNTAISPNFMVTVPFHKISTPGN